MFIWYTEQIKSTRLITRAVKSSDGNEWLNHFGHHDNVIKRKIFKSTFDIYQYTIRKIINERNITGPHLPLAISQKKKGKCLTLISKICVKCKVYSSFTSMQNFHHKHNPSKVTSDSFMHTSKAVWRSQQDASKSVSTLLAGNIWLRTAKYIKCVMLMSCDFVKATTWWPPPTAACAHLPRAVGVQLDVPVQKETYIMLLKWGSNCLCGS